MDADSAPAERRGDTCKHGAKCIFKHLKDADKPGKEAPPARNANGQGNLAATDDDDGVASAAAALRDRQHRYQAH